MSLRVILINLIIQGVTNSASAVAVAASIRSVSGNSVCADCNALSK